MVTKLYPVGQYNYDLREMRLDSPQGCNVVKGDTFLSDQNRFYNNVLQKRGVNRDYFILADEPAPSPNHSLEEKVELDLSVPKDDWREIYPIFYFIGGSLILSMILMSYVLTN